MATDRDSYQKLVAELRQIATLGSIEGLLSWDEQTQMPPRGAELRAQPIAGGGQIPRHFGREQVDLDDGNSRQIPRSNVEIAEWEGAAAPP
jgi:hypothetical protein